MKTKWLKRGLYFLLAIGVLWAAVMIRLDTVDEYEWETLARVAQSKCGSSDACVINLADAYPAHWTEAYIFEGEPEGYVEYWSRAKFGWSYLLTPDQTLACTSIVLLDEGRNVVGFYQSACDESIGPDFYFVKGPPTAYIQLEGYRKKDEGFVHFTRDAALLCAQGNAAHVNFLLTPYVKEKGCKP